MYSSFQMHLLLIIKNIHNSGEGFALPGDFIENWKL